ncbi:head-tail connector protein [Pararhizobium qamdonense]|uniref:head-tail connector protein n=1 Tax=Pararhizobium qamdonense TaxID=3031126 RepID=UPI0023E26A88|nr:head-tail connector protein [Pararhizobium qamdonense]
MSVITVEDVKRHLNVVGTDDDLLIADKIAAAEAFIGRWTLTPLAAMTEVPADLKEAVRLLTGHFYENREASIVGVSAEEIPFGLWDLINPHREYSF